MLKTAQNRLAAIASTLGANNMASEYHIPAMEDLPKVEGQHQGCLWGFFDKDGKRDECGSMRLLYEISQCMN